MSNETKPTHTNRDREMTMKDRCFTVDADGFISDNNFDFDAGMRVSGDFVGDEKRRYAEMIAAVLNAHAHPVNARLLDALKYAAGCLPSDECSDRYLNALAESVVRRGLSRAFNDLNRVTAERDALRNVCAEAYQLAGALDSPIEALDNLAAAMTGRPLPHESFLPVVANDRIAQQQAGTHPSPCARSCEANAYDLEIRRLNAEIASLRNAISNEHRQGALDAQSEAILICARIEDEQEGASGETWARTIRTEIERMLIDNAKVSGA